MPLGDDSAMAGVIADASPTPRSEALQQERIELLFQALAKLPEDQRTAITLRNFEELDFAEIGRRLHRSPEAARKLWARAIESLRDLLATDSLVLPAEWDSPQDE
jgi:RNA polymerase sigma-70 factor (ECF subfamily)